MSNSDYKAVINALNNYYGNKMNLYVEGSKYREEYGQKMKEQKELVEELQAKAKEWDKYKTHMESHIAGEVNEEEFVSDLKSDYFEGGEYDD